MEHSWPAYAGLNSLVPVGRHYLSCHSSERHVDGIELYLDEAREESVDNDQSSTHSGENQENPTESDYVDVENRPLSDCGSDFDMMEDMLYPKHNSAKQSQQEMKGKEAMSEEEKGGELKEKQKTTKEEEEEEEETKRRYSYPFWEVGYTDRSLRRRKISIPGANENPSCDLCGIKLPRCLTEPLCSSLFTDNYNFLDNIKHQCALHRVWYEYEILIPQSYPSTLIFHHRGLLESSEPCDVPIEMLRNNPYGAIGEPVPRHPAVSLSTMSLSHSPSVTKKSNLQL